MNNLTIVGRATKEPELRTSTYGDYCYLTVAVNAGQDKTDYFNVKIGDKQAKNCAKYVHKGDLVSVKGAVHLNQWGEGNRYAALSIHASQVEFFGKRREKNNETDGGAEMPKNNEFDGYEVVDDEDMPFC